MSRKKIIVHFDRCIVHRFILDFLKFTLKLLLKLSQMPATSSIDTLFPLLYLWNRMCTYLNWFFANWWDNKIFSISGFEYTLARSLILQWTSASSSVKRIQFHGDHSSFTSYRTIRNRNISLFSLTTEWPCQILFTKWYMSCFCIINAMAEGDSLFVSS